MVQNRQECPVTIQGEKISYSFRSNRWFISMVSEGQETNPLDEVKKNNGTIYQSH